MSGIGRLYNCHSERNAKNLWLTTVRLFHCLIVSLLTAMNKFFNKKFLAVGASILFLVILGAGCSQNQGPQTGSQNIVAPENIDKDVVFSDSNSAVSFTLKSYLQKASGSSTPGSVSAVFNRRPGSSGMVETMTFSTKTHDAWLAEKKPSGLCTSEDLLGCEKWDQDLALYNKALTSNNFVGYYALGASKTVVSGIPFVVIVTYNLDTKQYQTKYIAYVNNTRITFVDPATGGLEYGVPFEMNAKNRELIELTAQKLAKRQKVDDEKTRARADELYQMVATVKIGK